MSQSNRRVDIHAIARRAVARLMHVSEKTGEDRQYVAEYCQQAWLMGYQAAREKQERERRKARA